MGRIGENWSGGFNKIFCLDAATGAEIRPHQYAAEAGPTPVGPRATPTISGGKDAEAARAGFKCG